MGNPVTWFEVVGKDGAGLQKFYSDAFGWELEDAGMGYGMMTEPEKGIGGGGGPGQGGGRPGTVLLGGGGPQAGVGRERGRGGVEGVGGASEGIVYFAAV